MTIEQTAPESISPVNELEDVIFMLDGKLVFSFKNKDDVILESLPNLSINENHALNSTAFCMVGMATHILHQYQQIQALVKQVNQLTEYVEKQKDARNATNYAVKL